MWLRALGVCGLGLAVGCALVAVAILAGTVDAQAGPAAARVSHKSVGTLARNRIAARRDAPRLLAELRLPAGSTSSTSEPTGGGSRLKPAQAINATPARVDVHGWWRVPGSAASVLAYIRAHRPTNSHLESTGSGTGPSGHTVQTVTYGWPPIAGRLGARELQVTITSLDENVTGVLAQAESVWVIPRPAGEHIPASAHELDFTEAELNGPTVFSRSVSNASEVRRVASLLNALPNVQPNVYSCPVQLLSGAHVLTFDFRSQAGALLARATYTAWPSFNDLSTPCNPIRLMVGGRRWTPLVGGRFVSRAQRILGFSLTPVG